MPRPAVLAADVPSRSPIPAQASADPAARAAADRAPTWALLAAGVLLVALAGNRAGVAALGWIAPVPLAIAATRLRGRRRPLLFLACVAAVTLQTLKLVAAPATPAFALLFGVPIGALLATVLTLWDAVQRRAGPAWGVHAYAALTVLADVAGFALSPGGHWATSAAGQAENLPLMQLASLGGLGLVGLVLAYPAGAVTQLLVAPTGRRPWRTVAGALALALAAHAWGTFRLDEQRLGPTLRVASVSVDFPPVLRSMEDLRGNVDTLFERSELAARRGAQLVVWNEVATIVDRAEEPALLARAAALARAHRIDLVVAFGVVASRAPFRVENVFRWLGPDGAVIDGYQKHFLPPGEPSIAGTGPLRVVERAWGRAGGAICYDYDRPALAREHARGGAGLVFLPSSDWRGIDPQHTFMARVRAIEGGFSLLRAARAGTSAAFDPYGRVRASLSAWEENERVMLATVPTRQVRTLYARTGDLPVLVVAALLLAGAVRAGRRRAP